MAKGTRTPKKTTATSLKRGVVQKNANIPAITEEIIDELNNEEKEEKKVKGPKVVKQIIGHDRGNTHDFTASPFDSILLESEYVVVSLASELDGRKYLAKRLPDVVSKEEKQAYIKMLEKRFQEELKEKKESTLLDDFAGFSKKTWHRSNSVMIEENGFLSEISWMDYVLDVEGTKKLLQVGLAKYIKSQNGTLHPSQLSEIQKLLGSQKNNNKSDDESKKRTKTVFVKPTVKTYEPNNFFGPPVATMKFHVSDSYNPYTYIGSFFETYSSEFSYIDRDINDETMELRGLSISRGKSYEAEILPVLPGVKNINDAWEFQYDQKTFSGGAQVLAYLWEHFSFKFPIGRIVAIDFWANLYKDEDELYRFSSIEKKEKENEDSIIEPYEFTLEYLVSGFKEGDFVINIKEV